MGLVAEVDKRRREAEDEVTTLRKEIALLRKVPTYLLRDLSIIIFHSHQNNLTNRG